MGSFSLVQLKLKHSRWFLRSHGLQPLLLPLHQGSTIIHCWVPNQFIASRPPLLLIHGFGAGGTLAWEFQIASLSKHFSLYIPDLLFFGQSTTNNHLRSEFFQAECLWSMMQKLGIMEAIVAGHSYGGFVAFRMAHEYPQFVKRLIIVSSGICMKPGNTDALLKKFGATHIEQVLVPDSADSLRKCFKLVFNKLPWLPNFVYQDILESLPGDRQGKLELVNGIVLGSEEAPTLPNIEQDVLIIWGDQDEIFNMELAYQLKDFLGSKAKLEIIKGAGHVPSIVKAKEFNRVMLEFLTSL